MNKYTIHRRLCNMCQCAHSICPHIWLHNGSNLSQIAICARPLKQQYRNTMSTMNFHEM